MAPRDQDDLFSLGFPQLFQVNGAPLGLYYGEALSSPSFFCRYIGLQDLESSLSLPHTIIELSEMSTVSREWKKNGDTICLVPTMGALHAGHLALVDHASTLASRVVVSIFVNPSQFGPSEDFSKYPRTLGDDLDKLGEIKVDAVFTPNAFDIYPANFETWIENRGLSLDYCGEHRPQHFTGVQTVVLKLLNIVQSDHLVLGKKDYQQVKVLETMIRDLNIPTLVHAVDTIRESDGLALSSRNRYLDEQYRPLALALPIALNAAFDKFESGSKSRSEIEQAFVDELKKYPEFEIEYVKVANKLDLKRDGDEINEPSIILAAVRLGGVRLIDNLELG